MRTFNRFLGFIGGSVRRLAVLAAVVIFFGGQMMGWWQSPNLVNVNLNAPAQSTVLEGIASPQIWSGGKRAAENAAEHFAKHGQEFPFATEAAYVKAAQSFVRQPPPGTLMTVQDDGDRVYYNPELNFFAVTSPQENIRTFFRPDPKVHGYKTNMDYFHAQERK